MKFKLHWAYSLLVVLLLVIVGLHVYTDSVTIKTAIGFIVAMVTIFISNDRYYYFKVKNAAKE